MTRKIIICLSLITILSSISIDTLTASNIRNSEAMPHHAVIAHRGASYLAPEETEPAYILARELGADYLEFDIQLTLDGVPVLFHDDTLERTTNIAEVFPGWESSPVSAFSLDDLKSLDAGSWFNATYPDRARPSYKGLEILSLDDVIRIASSGRPGQRLYIESKNPEANPGVEKKIVTTLKNAGWLDESRIVFQSFSIDSLKRFQQAAPEIPRVYLINENMEKESGLNKFLNDAAGCADGIGPVVNIAWPRYIKKAHSKGMFVHVYMIDTLWQGTLVNCFGADGVFTDRCDLLLKYYRRGIKESPESILTRYGY